MTTSAPHEGHPGSDLPDEILGRLVRGVWCRWAREQPDPKPSWLVMWDDLDGGQREVDIRIGRAVAKAAVLFERERLFVAIRHALPLDAPWRGEALDLITSVWFDAPEPSRPAVVKGSGR